MDDIKLMRVLVRISEGLERIAAALENGNSTRELDESG